MKLPRLILATAVFVTAPAFAADKHEHAHDHESLHGGVVVEVKDIDLELVARPDVIQLYLRDHGKPVDVTSGSGKVTLLSGSEKQDVELKPTADRLEAKGSYKVGPGTKLVAVVTFPGKPSTTTRFALK